MLHTDMTQHDDSCENQDKGGESSGMMGVWEGESVQGRRRRRGERGVEVGVLCWTAYPPREIWMKEERGGGGGGRRGVMVVVVL